MLHTSPRPWPPTNQPPLFLLSVYFCNGKPRPHDLLRPICEQVTALRNKTNVHIRAVLADAEAHSLVKETVAHSACYGCPKCIMKGIWCPPFKEVSFTNGDTPPVNHSKYQSPLRTHAEFMAGDYNGTHRVAEMVDIT
ncbi:uncharacterized protein LOC128268107 isoform X2 [Anopheles cruzii]|uniref:uncharacterized protein LOC128268107 isoform X2 n=1 Tax=Anopheles cruzii TaxID=68878 RepID=UPI0022EC7D37|nr:uncharacterized protein LOC128268107 isoform X2 [Anopheles cruzii]